MARKISAGKRWKKHLQSLNTHQSNIYLVRHLPFKNSKNKCKKKKKKVDGSAEIRVESHSRLGNENDRHGPSHDNTFHSTIDVNRIENTIFRNKKSKQSVDFSLKDERSENCDKPALPDGTFIKDSILSPNAYPKSWTKRMIDYYFEPDEKLKHFDYVEILNELESNPSDWWINEADRSNGEKKRDFYIRCGKCNQRGHQKKDCKKYLVCYVCGEFNHSYSNCPHTLCFTCGRATKKYLKNCRDCRKILSSRKRCNLCGQIWHEETLCPSEWRKYSILRGECSHLCPNTRRFCYNCAQKGHFGFECPRTLESDYPPENPFKTAFPSSNHLCESRNRVFYHVVFLTKQTSNVLSSEKGQRFLRSLSENMNVRIELFCGKRCYVKLIGDDEIVNYCTAELLKWKAI